MSSKEGTGKKEPKKGDGMITRGAGPRGGDGGYRSPGLTPSSRIPERVKPRGAECGDKTAAGVNSTDIQRIIDKLDGLEERIESSTQHLTEKIDASKLDTEKLAEDCREVKVTTAGLKTQVGIHGTRLSDLEEKIEKLERDKRRNNLVIEGVPEQEREDLGGTVDSIFKDVGVGYNVSVCINLFRRGRKQSGERRQANNNPDNRPRPIVIAFLRQSDKSEFFRNLKNLKGSEKWKNVYFNDDHTELQATEQRDLRAFAAYAKGIGREASVKAGVLWFEGRRFRYEDLFKLPHDISLLKAKNLEILEGRGIVFQSPHSPLSNLFPCNLLYREIGFLSAEGAFQYSRAKVSGYDREAEEIRLERRPYRVKFMSKDIKASDDWEDIAESVMREILVVKFKSNKFCRQFLLSTGDKHLFEGTGDRRWGCGILISKSAQISMKNPGRNLLGHILESIRTELHQEVNPK